MASNSPAHDGGHDIIARWRGGWRCDVSMGEFTVAVDEPVSAGGEGRGSTPTDLLLASLASCYALSLAWAARKRGFDLPDLEVAASGVYEGPRFSAIHLAVSSSLALEHLTPLLEPAGRACYVSNTLAADPEITVTITPSPS